MRWEYQRSLSGLVVGPQRRVTLESNRLVPTATHWQASTFRAPTRHRPHRSDKLAAQKPVHIHISNTSRAMPSMLARGPACSGPAPSGSLGTGRQHSARLASRTGWSAVPDFGNSIILQCQWGRLKPHRARWVAGGMSIHLFRRSWVKQQARVAAQPGTPTLQAPAPGPNDARTPACHSRHGEQGGPGEANVRGAQRGGAQSGRAAARRPAGGLQRARPPADPGRRLASLFGEPSLPRRRAGSGAHRRRCSDWGWRGGVWCAAVVDQVPPRLPRPPLCPVPQTLLPPHTQAKNKRPSGSGGWGWISTWSGRVRRLLSSWVLYQVQQRLMLGALPAKVAGYFLLGAPAVVAGALLYK